MQLYIDEASLIVYKALASETRISILNQLAISPLTISELSQSMGITKAIMSRHIKMLCDAHLIKQSDSYASSDKRKKVFSLQVDRAEIVFPRKIYYPFEKKTSEIKLGYFSDFSVKPTCGLVSASSVIGAIDDPRVFVSNDRVNASLLWLADGYVEYKIPNTLEPGQTPEMIELSMELSSEFPISNNAWPSDITFYINNTKIGTWTCPGNFSDVRGKLTPAWWNSAYSQYGLLKHIRITRDNTGIDGVWFSSAKLSDLNLNDSPFITLRIGIEPNAVNKGGLTLFGDSFGNHPQNILLTVYYSEHD